MHNHKVAILGPKLELDHYILKRLLSRVKLHTEDFLLLDVRKPDFIQTCLKRGIKVIIPIGSEALLCLTGEKEVDRFFNRIIKLRNGLIVIPNYAPSALVPHYIPEEDDDDDEVGIRSPSRLHGVSAATYQRAIHIAAEGIDDAPEIKHIIDPPVNVFKDYVTNAINSNLPISFDIETDYKKRKRSEEDYNEREAQADKTIIRISFSYKEDEAVSIPFSPEYYESIRLILASSNDKIVWNGRTFDKPILEANGYKLGGTLYDGMDAFHFLQSDLEKGLEPVSTYFTRLLPWKHLNNDNPGLYSCIDAVAALLNFNGIKAALESQGRWNSFLDLCVTVMPHLDHAGNNGVHIDIPAQIELREFLQKEQIRLFNEVQDCVPEHLCPKDVYKKPPKDQNYKIIKIPGKAKRCSQCKALITSKSEHQKGKNNPCKGAETFILDELVDAYEVNLPFNPNSTQQVQNYIRYHNHPLAKNFKTRRETADAKHLRKLAAKYGRQHKLYSLIVESHKVNKALSTYVDGLKPDAAGKVYTTYTNTPSTWRLASKNVNMQNQGKREGNPYAAKARRTIIAPEGWKIVQADSSSIEAIMVGWFMNDPHYIELAKQSIHAYLCCMWLGWEFTPENVKRVKSEKKELYEQLKRVNHGTNYGMGPRLMYMNEPEIFPSVKIAKECQQFLFSALPGLEKWQHQIRVRAQKEGYLQNPFGVRHYFYDVFTYATDKNGEVLTNPDGLPKVKLGKDAKRAIAFLPQSSAGCFARQNSRIIGESEFRPFMPANFTVHDGYCLIVPDNLVDNAARFLYTVLTRPIPEMGGLIIPCEVEVGQNWKDMEKYRLE